MFCFLVFSVMAEGPGDEWSVKFKVLEPNNVGVPVGGKFVVEVGFEGSQSAGSAWATFLRPLEFESGKFRWLGLVRSGDVNAEIICGPDGCPKPAPDLPYLDGWKARKAKLAADGELDLLAYTTPIDRNNIGRGYHTIFYVLFERIQGGNSAIKTKSSNSRVYLPDHHYNPGSVDSVTVLDAYCGDGNINEILDEQCDDGLNNGQANQCSDECLLQVCGDGIIQPGLGETCDDGDGNAPDERNSAHGFRCKSDCTLNQCGDGFTLPVGLDGQAGNADDQTCDDGMDDGDHTGACIMDSREHGAEDDYVCKEAFCGDGYVWKTDGGNEQCDGENLDGSSCGDFQNDDDESYNSGVLGCSADGDDQCQFDISACFVCGNGVCELDAGEDYNACPNDCLPTGITGVDGSKNQNSVQIVGFDGDDDEPTVVVMTKSNPGDLLGVRGDLNSGDNEPAGGFRGEQWVAVITEGVAELRRDIVARFRYDFGNGKTFLDMSDMVFEKKRHGDVSYITAANIIDDNIVPGSLDMGKVADSPSHAYSCIASDLDFSEFELGQLRSACTVTDCTNGDSKLVASGCQYYGHSGDGNLRRMMAYGLDGDAAIIDCANEKCTPFKVEACNDPYVGDYGEREVVDGSFLDDDGEVRAIDEDERTDKCVGDDVLQEYSCEIAGRLGSVEVTCSDEDAEQRCRNGACGYPDDDRDGVCDTNGKQRIGWACEWGPDVCPGTPQGDPDDPPIRTFVPDDDANLVKANGCMVGDIDDSGAVDSDDTAGIIGVIEDLDDIDLLVIYLNWIYTNWG